MTLKEHCSVEQAIKFGVQQLIELSDSAKLDVQVLLGHVLKKEISYLLTWPEYQLTNEQISCFMSLLQERVKGLPIAYLIGTKEFWSLNFFVSSATLIPRPDTECLVELILAQHDKSPLYCLDLGTGTGAIALALASERHQWRISAVDFSAEAVALANKNAQQLNLTHVTIKQSDWFQSVDKSRKYDFIVSNPPYIDANDEHLLKGDVRFEPITALVANNEGLADILHIIIQAKHYLNDGGWLYFEHGFLQGQSVRALFAENGYYDALTVQDYSGNDRITYAQYKMSSQ